MRRLAEAKAKLNGGKLFEQPNGVQVPLKIDDKGVLHIKAGLAYNQLKWQAEQETRQESFEKEMRGRFDVQDKKLEHIETLVISVIAQLDQMNKARGGGVNEVFQTHQIAGQVGQPVFGQLDVSSKAPAAFTKVAEKLPDSAGELREQSVGSNIDEKKNSDSC